MNVTSFVPLRNGLIWLHQDCINRSPLPCVVYWAHQCQILQMGCWFPYLSLSSVHCIFAHIQRKFICVRLDYPDYFFWISPALYFHPKTIMFLLHNLIISCFFKMFHDLLSLFICSIIYSLCSFGLPANQPAVLFSHTKSAPSNSYQSISSTVLS